MGKRSNKKRKSTTTPISGRKALQENFDLLKDTEEEIDSSDDEEEEEEEKQNEDEDKSTDEANNTNGKRKIDLELIDRKLYSLQSEISILRSNQRKIIEKLDSIATGGITTETTARETKKYIFDANRFTTTSTFCEKTMWPVFKFFSNNTLRNPTGKKMMDALYKKLEAEEDRDIGFENAVMTCIKKNIESYVRKLYEIQNLLCLVSY